MTAAHPLKNTSKSYACTNCTSEHVSVIREDPNGLNPRLKCNNCQFMFDGKDSLDALNAGTIKPSSAESLADATEPEREVLTFREVQEKATNDAPLSKPVQTVIPNKPGYVFVSKPRNHCEFSTKRDLKRTAIRWSDSSFDLYELKAVKLSVDVNIT